MSVNNVWREKVLSEPAPVPVQDEWDSLFKTMKFWINYLQRSGKSLQLLTLVQEANYFAHLFRNFFADVSDKLYEQQDTSRTVALHQARGRLVSEWDIIQQALEQREFERYKSRLAELDSLAQECLKPILGQLEAEKVTTYFHKVYDITRFAFSQSPLIGVPYSALHLPESWLAVPHEAGHYIYWNSTKTHGEFNEFQNALENAVISHLANALNTQGRLEHRFFRRTGVVYGTWLAWLEEIFADVYGTLISGPASGWGIQASLLTRTDVKSLDEDDEEHPIPYLRPFIHIATLRQMAKLKPELANILADEANAQELAWKISWPQDKISQLQSPDGRGRLETMIKKDLPGIIEVLVNVPISSPDGTKNSLAAHYQAGKFYTLAQHQKIEEIVYRLRAGENIEELSRLELCTAAQLAIVEGVSPEEVRKQLGFKDLAAVPGDTGFSKIQRELLQEKFNNYLTGATGSKDVNIQKESWDLVIESNLSHSGEMHTHSSHHHPHSH